MRNSNCFNGEIDTKGSSKNRCLKWSGENEYIVHYSTSKIAKVTIYIIKYNSTLSLAYNF